MQLITSCIRKEEEPLGRSRRETRVMTNEGVRRVLRREPVVQFG
jgi:hypothetical protein